MSAGREGRDPVAMRIIFARSVRSRPSSRDEDGAVAVEARGSLDIVDAARGDVLRRELLQQIADARRSSANRVGGDFRAAPASESVDIAFAKPEK